MWGSAPCALGGYAPRITAIDLSRRPRHETRQTLPCGRPRGGRGVAGRRPTHRLRLGDTRAGHGRRARHRTVHGRGYEVVDLFFGAMPTGVTVSRHGRKFVCFPRLGDNVPFTVAELRDGKPVPYPNAEVTARTPPTCPDTSSRSRASSSIPPTGCGSSTPESRDSPVPPTAAPRSWRSICVPTRSFGGSSSRPPWCPRTATSTTCASTCAAARRARCTSPTGRPLRHHHGRPRHGPILAPPGRGPLDGPGQGLRLHPRRQAPRQ